MEIDEVKNRVSRNRDAKEHVAYIFDEVIPRMARNDVKIDVIGMGDGAPEVVGYLEENWEKWERNVQAVALGTGFVWSEGEVGGGSKFREFWGDVSGPHRHHSPLDLGSLMSNSALGRTSSVRNPWTCR